MENSFVIPARPWGEAEVKFLAANAHLLDEETKAELGFVKPEPINDFKADVDGPVDAGPAPVVETGPVDPVGVTTVGEAATEPVTVTETTVAPTTEGGLPTDAEGAVVDNQGTDNA